MHALGALRRLKYFSWWLVGIFVVALAAACIAVALMKMRGLGYNALDLAIFTNTLSQTADGQWFAMTIHPHSYFGDHVSPLLALLVPLFAVLRSPNSLLVVQAIAVALALVPIAALLRESLPRSWQVLVLGLVALNPLLHNAALFEFEFVVLAIPLLCAGILAYERRSFRWWLVLLLLTALIREDIGLLLCGWGLLALVDRRSRRWWLTPIVLGAATFGAGMLVTSLINSEQYKFLSYYGWLGDTPLAMVTTLVTKPWLIVLQLLRPHNLIFLVTLLLFTGGIALLRWRHLLPTVFVLAALLLTGFGGNAVTLQTHYPALLLPFLFWALIRGIHVVRDAPPRWLRSVAGAEAPIFAALVLLAIAVYGFFTMSPLRPSSLRALRAAANSEHTYIARSFIEQIQQDASVAASFDTLAELSTQKAVYSLHYAWSGHRQLSQVPYVVPDDVDTILYDSRDAVFYDIQFGNDAITGSLGGKRLRELFMRSGFTLTGYLDTFLFARKDGGTMTLPFTVGLSRGRPMQDSGTPVELVAVDGQGEELLATATAVGDRELLFLPIDLTWQTTEVTDDNYRFRVMYRDDTGEVRATRTYEPAYGLLPTSTWAPHTPILTRYFWAIPKLPAGTYTVSVQAEATEGYLSLDAKLTAVVTTTAVRTAGPAVVLGRLRL